MAGQRGRKALPVQVGEPIELFSSASAFLEGADFQVLVFGYALHQGVQELDRLLIGVGFAFVVRLS